MTHRSNVSALLLALALLAPGLAAQEGAFTGSPSLDGYSPVSYFTEGQAEQGSEAFAVTVDDGRVYYLTSQAQVDLFNAAPEKYLPRYQLCPYSLIHGRKLPLDPTNFKIIGGQLLIFHQSSENGDGLAAWENSELSDQELIELADKQYRLLSF